MPDIDTKVEFIIEFGKRLAGHNLTPAISRDIANGWAYSLRYVTRAGKRPAHALLLAALTEMETRFAAEVASCLNLVIHRDLLDVANEILNKPELEAHVREKLAAVIKDAARLAASTAWYELDDQIDNCRRKNQRVTVQ